MTGLLIGLALASEAVDVDADAYARRQVAREVAVNADGLKACYETTACPGEPLQGRVVFDLDVAKDGAVTHARIAESTLEDEPVEACLLKVFEGMRFAPTEAGFVALYPLVFTPPED